MSVAFPWPKKNSDGEAGVSGSAVDTLESYKTIEMIEEVAAVFLFISCFLF